MAKDKENKKRKPGPKPEILKLEEKDWEKAVREALKKRPPDEEDPNADKRIK